LKLPTEIHPNNHGHQTKNDQCLASRSYSVGKKATNTTVAATGNFSPRETVPLPFRVSACKSGQLAAVARPNLCEEMGIWIFF